MARSPDWYARLDDILAALDCAAVPEQLGRPHIESLFRLGRRDSLRLLHRFGGGRTGETLTVGRGELRRQLEALRRTGSYQAYRAQRATVGQAVRAETTGQATGATRRAERYRIAGAVDFVRRSSAELPAGVRLEPGRLTVDFTLVEELWQALDQLADVAAADREAFEQRAEGKET